MPLTRSPSLKPGDFGPLFSDVAAARWPLRRGPLDNASWKGLGDKRPERLPCEGPWSQSPLRQGPCAKVPANTRGTLAGSLRQEPGDFESCDQRSRLLFVNVPVTRAPRDLGPP
ncbi:hypothetical protein M885DRAFT_12933 [Pelagophyceae sp. CCMP2097]|nr:hypothetical protein M885DRAFT_12933 [Pelagophyceae sp. CCMP2097]